MLYSEAAYFDGYHFQHIAAWQENLRLQGIQRAAGRMIERRRSRRA